MTAAQPQKPASPPSGALPRVLVVDDSAVVRGLTARWIEADARLELAGTCADGEQGVRRAGELQPDLVVLDVEMPRMDGLAALPLILKAAPRARVVMASTLTRSGAQVTVRALSLGAADYAAKPEAGKVAGAEAYREELLRKLLALSPRAAAPVRAAPSAPLAAPRPASALAAKPSLIAIGSSTGGPQALREVLAHLPADTRAPVLITQHMPKLFTAILAEHLSKLGLPAAEAQDGEPLRAGRVYLAPGDWHMTVRTGPEGFHAVLDQGPQVNFCRPAVDPLFKSLAAAAGRNVLAVVLTGMGADGREGARALRAAGAPVIVQDQATSVVWGMPGAVAEAGLADMILPLKEIGPQIVRRLKGLP
ncbi:chemotaxis response regulator protein-glutamate methylesterase [Alkalicaulis satelles]|uniref:Protein-glutamate methylesterase/protein-glutamine glutaminase n=1 Tax=Alkalicaulis satelles TaxID=2609175 RepID=A0A5M6ZGF3_9PROT|nr:chemotaxis response regulator protein-glutamate methylesterase [Alkalicaulis satelles]KAA5803370.1 chemotaxis response regulator protein-glutamate methylesterase [Alkalicaulis satelles]